MREVQIITTVLSVDQMNDPDMVALVGAAAAVWLHNITEQMTAYITAVAIGGFIYIAVGDLLPELKKDSKLLDSLRQLIGIILGVTMMAGLLLLE